MKILFICSQNIHRSRTAEDIFKGKFETKSAGLFNEKPVTAKQLEWADLIIVMEDFHRREIAERFPRQYMQKRIISLGIPDMYNYGNPELVEILKKKLAKALKEIPP